MNQRTLSWTTRAILFARSILRLLEGVVCDIILAWAPDEALTHYNELTYSDQSQFQGDHPNRNAELFPWEHDAIARHFPPPPARILVGAAGGGREAYCLADRGYRVVAFDLSATLLRSMVAGMGERTSIEIYRGSYEDLPWLDPLAEDGARVRLDELGPFDAAIVGWGSLSHLRTDAQCVHTLREFATVTPGPVLVSWLGRSRQLTARRRWLRRLLPGRRQRDYQTRFTWSMGFHRGLAAQDLEHVFAEAGLEAVHQYDVDARSSDVTLGFPHAVLRPRLL